MGSQGFQDEVGGGDLAFSLAPRAPAGPAGVGRVIVNLAWQRRWPWAP
jgi:hypothetical protein